MPNYPFFGGGDTMVENIGFVGFMNNS